MGDQRTISVITATLMVACIPGSLHAVTIDCAPLKPGRTTDSTIEDTIKGQANLLVRALGSGSIENSYRQVEADTLARYPGADKLLLWREYIYVSCALIASSSKWSDDDKWDKWMRLMNRWGDQPPDANSAKALQGSQPLSSANVPMPTTEQRPIVGGIALGASLAEVQSRKDISLSLDSDGNPYGEEVFTFAYGSPPSRHLDGRVVFGTRDDVVDSITVTHILDSDSCADSAMAGMVLSQEIHEWGAPLQRVVSQGAGGKDGETKSFTFRRGNTDTVLVLQTSAGPVCRVSMNYQTSLSGDNTSAKR
jgi:hypothetical protein